MTDRVHVYRKTDPPRPRNLNQTAVDLILNRGLVIDSDYSVSLMVADTLTGDSRTIVTGLDTYLRLASVAAHLDRRSRLRKASPSPPAE